MDLARYGLDEGNFNNRWTQQGIDNQRADRGQQYSEYMGLSGLNSGPTMPNFQPYGMGNMPNSNSYQGYRDNYSAGVDNRNYWTGVGNNFINGYWGG